MEAGYDYLLLRGRLKRRLFTFSGIALSILGIALLAAGGVYYGYATKARADLDGLVAQSPGPDSPGGAAGMDIEPSVASGIDGPNAAPPGLSASAIANHRLYPGGALMARSWSNPLANEPVRLWEQALIGQFTPIEANTALPVGQGSTATRIAVPSVGVNSTVTELAIMDLGDSRAYETPAFAVGHIPESANAGEGGSAWFFGHLESPIRSEGSVFYNLQEIPDRLRSGQDVYIFTDNGQRQYLYRVTETEVVHQRDMKLYDTGKATIHLVTCVPRLVYDHRLIVTGELIAERQAADTVSAKQALDNT